MMIWVFPVFTDRYSSILILDDEYSCFRPDKGWMQDSTERKLEHVLVLKGDMGDFRVLLDLSEPAAPNNSRWSMWANRAAKGRYISTVPVFLVDSLMKHTVFMACYGIVPQSWDIHARPHNNQVWQGPAVLLQVSGLCVTCLIPKWIQGDSISSDHVLHHCHRHRRKMCWTSYCSLTGGSSCCCQCCCSVQVQHILDQV